MGNRIVTVLSTLPRLHRKVVLAAFILAMILSAEGALAGFYYTVKSGDTLPGIAGRFGTSTAMIKMSNQLSDSARISPGTKLWIEVRRPVSAPSAPPPRTGASLSPRTKLTPYPGPGASTTIRPLTHSAPLPTSQTHVLSLSTKSSLSRSTEVAAARTPIPFNEATAAKPRASTSRASKASAPLPMPDDDKENALIDVPGGGTAPAPPKPVLPPPSSTSGSSIKPSKSGFIWPVEGRVTRRFTSNSEQKYGGIDIAVPRGTEVRAAASGTIAYADDAVKGYGRMVIIQHPGGLATCYAQNEQLLVRRGQSVSRGQVIARSGNSGRGGEPFLHLEIRDRGTAVNPEAYLP